MELTLFRYKIIINGPWSAMNINGAHRLIDASIIILEAAHKAYSNVISMDAWFQILKLSRWIHSKPRDACSQDTTKKDWVKLQIKSRAKS